MAVFNNILAGASGQAGGAAGAIEIERSLRFNSADSAYLNRTPSSAGNQKTWTWSGWVKRSSLGSTYGFFGAGGSGSPQPRTSFYFESDDSLYIFSAASSATLTVDTTAVFRDTSAWYHIVVALDTTQATAANRLRIYINGVEQTSFATATYPAQNSDEVFNSAVAHNIGATNGPGNYFDGYLADVHFIDGQALDPTDFGEFDDNNVWQPIEYAGTYGTNGFHLKFDNTADLGEDAAGSNDWTVNNISGPFASATAIFNASLNATPFSDATGNETITNNGSITTASAGTNSFNISNAADTGSAGQWLAVTSVTIPSEYTIDYYYKSTNSSQLSNATVIDSNGEVFIRDYGSATGRTLRLRDASSYTGYAYNVTLNTWNHVRITNTGIWVNGTSISSSPRNIAGRSSAVTIGSYNNSDGYRFDGLIGPVRILDVDLGAPASGGEPTDSGSLPNTEATSTSTGADNDSVFDSPTNGTQTDTGAGGEVSGNYATMSPNLHKVDYTIASLSNGNLQVDWVASRVAWSDFGLTSGKWYYETTMLSGVSSSLGNLVRVGRRFSTSYNAFLWRSNGATTGLTGNPTFSTYATGDVLGIAIDVDNEQATFYKNGTLQGTGAYSYLTAGGEPIYVGGYSNYTSASSSFNFGQQPWKYSAPSGYKAFCTANLPDPTIADGSTAMDVVTYSGNSSNQTISGLAFSPDAVWIKNRSDTTDHFLANTVAGAGYFLYPNLDNAENYDILYKLQAFNSDGFDLGGNGQVNGSGYSYVGWCWDGGSSTAANTDGSISSSVRANASAGFSIVSYSGNGTSGATIGHGLGVAPQFIITKRRNSAALWQVGHQGIGWTHRMYLDATNAASATIAAWNNTAPTSTVFTAGSSSSVNASGSTYIAYCWAPVEGYSAFGSYTGNGSSDGPFVYTGFRPRWILRKGSSVSATSWYLIDAERDSYNTADAFLSADDADAEVTGTAVDILSNGFKLRNPDAGTNSNGSTYIYAAFAENPFKYARAR